MNDLVTIVIPTYHRPDRIARAVESCLKQTCQKEIIVVDDNGRGTPEQEMTMQALMPFMDRIRYLTNEVNSKASFSRNQGLKEASGNFITFLDDDDEIAPEKLEKQIDLLNHLGEEYSCCYTNYHKILSGGKIYRGNEHASGAVYPYLLARVIYNGSGSNLLCRTEVARKIGGYDTSFLKRQDMEFMARMCRDYKLAYLDEDLLTIHYEIRENKLTYQGLAEADEHWLDFFHKEIESLPSDQKSAVYQSLALERWRYSIPRHQQKDAWRNMQKYHVTAASFLKYLCYLTDRVIGKKSYGFKLIRL